MNNPQLCERTRVKLVVASLIIIGAILSTLLIGLGITLKQDTLIIWGVILAIFPTLILLLLVAGISDHGAAG